MKLVATNIRLRDWDAVRAALMRLGVHDIHLTTVQVLAAGNGRAQLHAGAEYIVDRVRQLRIEVAIDDSQVAGVIAALGQYHGYTGSGATVVSCLQAV